MRSVPCTRLTSRLSAWTATRSCSTSTGRSPSLSRMIVYIFERDDGRAIIATADQITVNVPCASVDQAVLLIKQNRQWSLGGLQSELPEGRPAPPSRVHEEADGGKLSKYQRDTV